MLVHGLPYPTYLLPADSADVGIATAVGARELHVVLLVRARDPLHAAAGLIREPGYRCVNVGLLIALCKIRALPHYGAQEHYGALWITYKSNF